MNAASDLLREAAAIVEGDRGVTHGPRERSFAMVADMWAAYLGYPVSAVDVCWMMTLLKVGRAKCGTPLRDHFVDATGYSAIAGELSLLYIGNQDGK